MVRIGYWCEEDMQHTEEDPIDHFNVWVSIEAVNADGAPVRGDDYYMPEKVAEVESEEEAMYLRTLITCVGEHIDRGERECLTD